MTREATTTDPNSVLEIESMELPVILNGKNQEISDSNTSDLDDELDTLIPSVQNQNEATTPPETTPTTNKVFISPRVFSSSSIGFIGSPFSKFSAYPSPVILSAVNSPNAAFTPKKLEIPESHKDIKKEDLSPERVDKISKSPLRDLRKTKQYQSLRDDKSPTFYSDTKLYQYASDKNSKVRVSNEKNFAGDELSKLVIANITSAKEQFLARCLKKKIVINTENINKFVLKVIEFAQENEGVAKVSDAENKWHKFTKDNEALNQFSYKDAKAFSSIYQSVSDKNGIYSGRQENLRSDIKVAARLKRIPADLNDRIEQSLNHKVETRSI